MAKKPSKTLVDKVLEGADKILHPENHETASQEQAQEMIDKGEATIPPEALENNETLPAGEAQFEGHKKFDKFKKGEP